MLTLHQRASEFPSPHESLLSEPIGSASFVGPALHFNHLKTSTTPQVERVIFGPGTQDPNTNGLPNCGVPIDLQLQYQQFTPCYPYSNAQFQFCAPVNHSQVGSRSSWSCLAHTQPQSLPLRPRYNTYTTYSTLASMPIPSTLSLNSSISVNSTISADSDLDLSYDELNFSPAMGAPESSPSPSGSTPSPTPCSNFFVGDQRAPYLQGSLSLPAYPSPHATTLCSTTPTEGAHAYSTPTPTPLSRAPVAEYSSEPDLELAVRLGNRIESFMDTLRKTVISAIREELSPMNQQLAEASLEREALEHENRALRGMLAAAGLQVPPPSPKGTSRESSPPLQVASASENYSAQAHENVDETAQQAIKNVVEVAGQ